ncbi:MAG: acyl-CoA thioesterase [Gammaproteobacteria bacterium]|nr:acyl-CoA thioesterase [Gammaproteobacteria bacterium]
MFKNSRAVSIEWGDCDPAGIVFYPRYFAYFDAATANLFDAAGFKKIEMLKKFNALGFPMVDTRAKFYIPSRYGDEVEIVSTVTEFRRSSFDVHHQLLKDGKLAVEGFETRVWTIRDPEDSEKIKSAPLPEEIVTAFMNG